MARKMRALRIAEDGDRAVQEYADAHDLTWSEAARRLLAAGLAASSAGRSLPSPRRPQG